MTYGIKQEKGIINSKIYFGRKNAWGHCRKFSLIVLSFSLSQFVDRQSDTVPNDKINENKYFVEHSYKLHFCVLIYTNASVILVQNAVWIILNNVNYYSLKNTSSNNHYIEIAMIRTKLIGILNERKVQILFKSKNSIKWVPFSVSSSTK